MTTNNTVNRNFAQVFNAFTEPANEAEKQYKLTAQELYLFAHLNIRKNRVGDVPSVLTSVDLLAQMITLQKKPSANKKAIRVALDSLQSKGIISFDVTASNTDLLEVFFSDNAVLEESGFERVYGELFDLADNAEQFMILCVVQRWQSSPSGVCTTGYERWMEILECGRGKVCSLLDGMKAPGKIIVSSGKNKRSYNRYLVGNGVPVEVAEDVMIDAVEDVQDAIQDTVDVSVDALVEPEDVPPMDVPVGVIDDAEDVQEAARDDVEYDEQSLNDAENDDEPFENFDLDLKPLEYSNEEDMFSKFEDDSTSEGVKLARHLAENQPPAAKAKDVLYGEQFTDQHKPIQRAVLSDPYIYANHFKVNPNEDVYAQVERLRRGYEYYGVELYLEMDLTFVS